MLNLIEQVLGPDIAGMPNWNLRDKSPNNEATTLPWHQGTDLTKKQNGKKTILIKTYSTFHRTTEQRFTIRKAWSKYIPKKKNFRS